MKALAFLAIVLLMTGSLWPYSSISGYVTDMDTEKPIKKVKIIIREDDKAKKIEERGLYSVYSNQSGFFNMTIAPGKYLFIFDLPGFDLPRYKGYPEDFYYFEVSTGQSLTFIFLVGKSKFPVVRKRISRDGNTIYYKMLLRKRKDFSPPYLEFL